MYRSASPYRPPASPVPSYPVHPPAAQPQSYPTQAANVPGSITYTTSTGPDGMTIYHPFTAVAASYKTASGVVSGIQWLPSEPTRTLPPGAQPATPEFAASWSRGYLAKDDKLTEWQREEDKKRKKEEKESAKRLKERNAADAELQRARELDVVARERRKSFNAGPGVAFPQGGPAPVGHPNHSSSSYQPYVDPATGAHFIRPPSRQGGDGYGHERKPSNVDAYGRERKQSNVGYDDLNRQFNKMGLDRDQDYPGRERKVSFGPTKTDERQSLYSNPSYGSHNTSPYTSPYAPPVAMGYATSSGKYSNPSPNHRPVDLPYGGKYSNPSPNHRPTDLPPHGGPGNTVQYPGSQYSSSGKGAPQVYPRGHVMEGQPISKSRAPSPMPVVTSAYQGPINFPEPPTINRSHSPHPGGVSPNAPPVVLPGGQSQLTPPEGFSRPISSTATFVPFEIKKVKDLDSSRTPKMPSILKSHDIYPEDWERLLNDVKLAWSGKLPVPVDASRGQPPRRTTLVADLVDLWNGSFFLRRGVELALYKGCEHRSGPKIGTVNYHLPSDEDESEEEDDSEDDDDEAIQAYLARSSSIYGQPTIDPVMLAKQRREAREEKRRAREERRAKEKAKRFTLFINCVPLPGNQHQQAAAYGASGMPGGYPHSSNYSSQHQHQHHQQSQQGGGYPTPNPSPGGYPPASYTGGYPPANHGGVYPPQGYNPTSPPTNQNHYSSNTASGRYSPLPTYGRPQGGY